MQAENITLRTMISREIIPQLRHLLMTDHRAILLTGARQVGKTFTIRQVGQECFDNFVEINFIERPEAVSLFSGYSDVKDLLLRISALVQKSLTPQKTLIFFDEVQQCPEILTAIKFLVDEGSCKYILSGSLLGVQLSHLRSVPVGYLIQMEMYPLDLSEFFQAIGIGSNVLEHIRSSYENKTEVDSFIHNRLIEATRLYLLIGGMPAVVQRYIDTNNLSDVLTQQQGIIQTYKRDISQYATKDKLQIEEIYDLIPAELNAKNKRFILKELNQKARFRAYENSFVWLKEAGVAIPVYNIEEPELPLLLNKQRNLFKLFCNDVGLLSAMFGPDFQTRLLSNHHNINFGAIFENLVAQQLYAHGFAHEHALYYFNNKRQGELDFVVELNGVIVPIEVKSGKDYQRHRALSNVLSNPDYNIEHAIVFSHDNLHTTPNITYLPIYMLACLKRDQTTQIFYHFDLTGLK